MKFTTSNTHGTSESDEDCALLTLRRHLEPAEVKPWTFNPNRLGVRGPMRRVEVDVDWETRDVAVRDWAVITPEAQAYAIEVAMNHMRNNPRPRPLDDGDVAMMLLSYAHKKESAHA